MQSLPISTNVVSSNPVHGEVYSIQHHVIKFVSDLRQIGGLAGLNLLMGLPPIPPLDNWLSDFFCVLTPLSAVFQLYHGDQF